MIAKFICVLHIQHSYQDHQNNLAAKLGFLRVSTEYIFIQNQCHASLVFPLNKHKRTHVVYKKKKLNQGERRPPDFVLRRLLRLEPRLARGKGADEFANNYMKISIAVEANLNLAHTV